MLSCHAERRSRLTVFGDDLCSSIDRDMGTLLFESSKCIDRRYVNAILPSLLKMSKHAPASTRGLKDSDFMSSTASSRAVVLFSYLGLMPH